PSTIPRFAPTRRIRTASTSPPLRLTSPTTAARRSATRRSAFMSIITRCGSIPTTPITSSWETTAVLRKPGTRAATGTSSTPSRSASPTSSATTWRFRTTSAPAIRTTAPGAGRRGGVRASSRTPTGRRSAAERRRIIELRVRQRADSNETDLRWNWNTPFLISAHNPETFYAGANKVMKSTRRGEDLYPISPDLTTKDSMKIRVSTRTTGGVTPDVTGAETYCTIVSLAESPIRPGLLYAGTDDGNVWITKNDGGTWDNITGRFPGVPAGTYVSRIEPSHFDTATFYITFDNHRSGDYAPYVFVTTDF